MTHPRKQIRDAVVQKLLDSTHFGDRVTSNRSYTVDANTELPVALVYSNEETSEIVEEPTGLEVRELTLMIEIVGRDPDDEAVDDVLDDLCEKVEAVMKADRNLSGTAMNSYLVSTQIGTDSEGDVPLGSALLSYTVRYTHE